MDIAMNKPLQILFRPRFEGHVDVNAPAGSALAEIIASWREVMPQSQPAGHDFEDWVENAVQLHHALQAVKARSHELSLFIDQGSGVKPELITHVAMDGQAPKKVFDTEQPFVMLGMEAGDWDLVRSSEMVVAPSRSDQLAAEAYASNAGFWKHAGRQMILATYNDHESDVPADVDLMEVIKHRRDAGQNSVIVKVNEGKAGIARVNIAGRSDTELHDDLMEIFDWTLIRMGGIEGGFLVQDDVVMEHEYRVFVVDGQPVSGAGCLFEHTPLNNLQNGFDLQTRRIRPNGESEPEPITNCPGVIERYRQALPQIIEDLMRGDARLQDFVVDLCLIDDEVRVVEVNPSRNAGLYALDVGALINARIDKGLRQRLEFERDPQAWIEQVHAQASTPRNNLSTGRVKP